MGMALRNRSLMLFHELFEALNERIGFATEQFRLFLACARISISLPLSEIILGHCFGFRSDFLIGFVFAGKLFNVAKVDDRALASEPICECSKHNRALISGHRLIGLRGPRLDGSRRSPIAGGLLLRLARSDIVGRRRRRRAAKPPVNKLTRADWPVNLW